MMFTLPAAAGLTVVVLSLLLGVSSFYVYTVTRQPREFIQSFLALGAAIFAVAEIPLTMQSSDATLLWGMRMQLTGAAIHVIAWLHLSLITGTRGPIEVPRAQRGLYALLIGLALISLVPELSYPGMISERSVRWLNVIYRDPTPTMINEVTFGALIVGLMIAFVRITKRGITRSLEARLHAGALFLLICAGITDTLTVTHRIESPYVLTLGLFISVVVSWFLATRQFAKNARASLEASRSLAATVELRNRALDRTREELQRAEKLAGIGRLAAGVAHEINNPAAVVISNVQFVLDELQAHGGSLPDSAEVEHVLRRSLAQMERVDRIVKDLLIAGRVAGRQETYHETITLRRPIEEALELCDLTGVALELDVKDGRIVGHHAVLIPILRNLISNALDAMREVDRPTTLSIRTWFEDEWAAIEVRDQGHGMNDDTLRDVFEPFFTTKPPGRGTGLGLSVSLGLVRSLGGRLSFTSEPDVGTTAVLRLQRAS